jgi:hypothetical protein
VACQWHERYHPVIAHLNGALTAKFGPFIAIHLRRLADHGAIRDTDAPLELGQTSCCYMRNGWTLPVHTHSLGQIMQSFVYFPVSDDIADLGTMMCRFKHSMPWHGDADAVQAYSIDEEIEDVAAAPYAANQLFAFLNTPNSPHRVPAVAGAPDRRYVFTQNTLTQAALKGELRPICSDDFRFDITECR